MVAHGNTLIIGTYDDVKEILLALVVAIAAVVVAATLHKVDSHLIIVVAYLGIFSIYRLPCVVFGSARYIHHFHSLSPYTIGIDRYAHSRLDKVVVDIDAKFALLYNSLVAIREGVGEQTILLGKDKGVLAIGRLQRLLCTARQRRHKQ